MKKLFLTIVACVGMISANAQTMTIEIIQHVQGEGGSFDICIKTEANEYSGYQMYLYVPVGTEFATKSSGALNTAKILADGAICEINESTVNYQFVKNGGSAEAISGFDQYLITAYENDNVPLATQGEGGSLLTVKYTKCDAEKMKVIITAIELARPDGTNSKIERIESTGITGIAADKAETANDGKFVENNRVVIKKAGVKYSTTGQVIK